MLATAYRLDVLTFAAYARCSCGAGLALPLGGSKWECSRLLLGESDRVTTRHDRPLSADLYDVAKEGTRRADGATTRP